MSALTIHVSPLRYDERNETHTFANTFRVSSLAAMKEIAINNFVFMFSSSILSEPHKKQTDNSKIPTRAGGRPLRPRALPAPVKLGLWRVESHRWVGKVLAVLGSGAHWPGVE